MLDISVFIRYNKLIKRNREIKEEKNTKEKRVIPPDIVISTS